MTTANVHTEDNFREGGRVQGIVTYSALPKYAFNAKELDEETGMYYYEARYMAPPTFISRDPMFEQKPWLSPYHYCNNNPLKYVDPTGMDWYETEDGNIEWTDCKNQAEMNKEGIKGNYLGEAFVYFRGSNDEQLGQDGKMTGKGAKPAQVTIYGINGENDVKTYNGMTTPKSDEYSTLNEGDYRASYQDMATSPYGTAGAKSRGIPTALTYKIKSLDGGSLKGMKNGQEVEMNGVFLHRTDWNGTASNSSKGCLIIDGRDWRNVEKQLGKSSNIRIRVIR